MIEWLIKFSIKQRLIVILMTFCLIASGVIGLTKLPIDAVPDITNVQVQLLTAAPALAPLDVERQITTPVEIGLRGLPGIQQIRSISKFGLSVVTVVFDDSTDIYFARQLVQERLSQIRQQIPSSIESPQLGPISTGLGEIYQYELVSRDRTVDLSQLRTIQDWLVRRRLLTVPGVAEVNSYGGLKKQFQVRVDASKLLSYQLSLKDLIKAVEANNQNVCGAYIEHQGEQYLLRGIGLVQTPEQIGMIVVKTGKDGTPVFVKDLAQVVADAEVRQGAVLADGRGETVAGIVMMLKGENASAVVNGVKQKIVEIQKSLPSGVEIVPFYDRSELTNRTIDTVQSNLIEGALLVVAVLLLLLGNWRGAILVASVIPLSMLFASICMSAFKISGNLMSLGALDFGLIVDGAVVMVENAVRRLAEAKKAGWTENPKEVILRACTEVGKPVAFAVLIIAIVYLPILSLSGIEGKMFKPMSLTIVFALLGSLILTLTYVPAMLTLIMGRSVSDKESLLTRYLHPLYERALALMSINKPQVFAFSLVLVILSLLTFPLLGSEFIPRLDEGALTIQMQQLPSISIEQSIANVTRAEHVLRGFPELGRIVSKIGRAEVATDPMGVDTADIYVELKPSSMWPALENREILVEKVARKLQEKVPEAIFSFSQPVELRTSELIAGVRSELAIKIFGDDLDTLKNLAEKVSTIVSKTPGACDVKVEQTSGLPQLTVTADREAIARNAINVEDLNDVVEAVVAGKPAGQIFEGDKRFDMVVKLDNQKKIDPNSIKSILVHSGTKARVPLSSVATVQVEEGPSQISREDGQRRIVVELNVRGRDLGSFVKEARQSLDNELKLPEGYHLSLGGQFENMEHANQTLLMVVPIALVSIFVLLFLTFGSVSQSLLIFSGIPFALVGGIFALAIRGMPFSISAGIGLIALSGVAVLNGVVMVSCINSLRNRMELEEAVKQGALARLRPVMMTALVASLGFLPMAFSTMAGAEVQRPLATVVIGGLISSSVLTLLILPNLYVWFEKTVTFFERQSFAQDCGASSTDSTPTVVILTKS